MRPILEIKFDYQPTEYFLSIISLISTYQIISDTCQYTPLA